MSANRARPVSSAINKGNTMKQVSAFNSRVVIFCTLFALGLGLPSPVSAQKPIGIDTSHWNGVINWAAVATNGIKFAFTKATESNWYADDTLDANMANARAAGVLIGPYHFARPTNNTATAQADFFVSVAGKYMTNGYLRPVLDLEVEGPALGKTAMSTWANTFCNRVKALTGASPIIYTGQYFALDYLNSTVTNWPVWIATWPCGSCVWPCPAPCTPDIQNANPSATPWTKWAFWQYAGEVTGLPGCPSTTDLDVFNGTLAELQAYLIGGGSNPPSITQQPANTSVVTNGTANFTVVAYGGGTLHYQWQKNNNNLANGGHYSGCTTNQLTITGADNNDIAYYRCVITNAYGSVTSSNASLTLNVSCEPNPLVNANFEGGNANGVAAGWTSYELNAPSTKVWSIQTASSPEGSQYQQIQAYNVAHTASAGVRQDITGCTVGATYQIAGWYRSNSDSGRARVRVSPNASADWNTALDLNPVAEYGSTTVWATFSGTVVATGPSMTLWLDGRTITGTSAKVGCFDAVTVTCLGAPIPLRINSTFLLPQKQLRLVVSGEPGDPVTIQRSSNLVNWVTWTNVVNTTGTVEFTDATTNATLRYYRAKTP